MNSKNSSVTAQIENSTHRLEGKALARWWQVDEFFKIKKARVTIYTNHAIRSILGLILTILFYAYVGLSTKYHMGMAEDMFIVGIVLLEMASFVALMFFFRRHQNLIMKVRVTEEGLELESLWLKRKVRWLEIADFFQTGNNEVGYNEWLIDCTNGDQLILSSDLTDSDKLFASITRRIQAAPDSYQSSYRISDGLFDAVLLAIFSVLLAISAGSIRWLMSRPTISPEAMVSHLVIPGLLALVVLAYWRLHNSKVPQLIRVGSSGIFLRTRAARHFMGWDQVTKIVTLKPFMIIKSRSGWFISLADKKEPVIGKLIEYKKSMPMI